MIVVIAEKPSVARELAAVLGATNRRDGYLEGGGYRVTWAVGHLVRLAEPHEIRAEWKAWSRAALPMLPDAFPLVPIATTRDQYRVVERLLRARETASLIVATDAGREGELIFRTLYEHCRCDKPWRRLWLSSLTPAAIRSALEQLKAGSHYDGLAAAARARSQADWLVGMNLSRAYTLTSGELYAVGRVQTPTLAMVVERDQAIRDFVPTPYVELETLFETAGGRYSGLYYAAPPEGLRDERGQLRPFSPGHARLPADGELARRIAERVPGASAQIATIDRSERRTPPPQLYDLTELQRHANQLFGYTAQQTLDAAQALYEQKLLSYPRTDSRHLSTEIAKTLPDLVATIRRRYAQAVATSSDTKPLSKRFVDDSKVGDHHALVPSAQERAPRLLADSAEERIYDLVCRRLLSAWHADFVEAVTRVVTEVRSSSAVDVFATQGTAVEAVGWKVLELTSTRTVSAPAPTIPGGLAAGDRAHVASAAIRLKKTAPPKLFTEATLLTAMETAGRHLDDRALTEAMRGSGLGTPATRAATLEALIGRGYLERTGKSLRATAKGAALVAAVHPLVKSPEMTGQWEQRLQRMEHGEESLDPFMRDIAAYVRSVVDMEAQRPELPRSESLRRPPNARRRQARRAARRTKNGALAPMPHATKSARPEARRG